MIDGFIFCPHLPVAKHGQRPACAVVRRRHPRPRMGRPGITALLSAQNGHWLRVGQHHHEPSADLRLLHLPCGESRWIRLHLLVGKAAALLGALLFLRSIIYARPAICTLHSAILTNSAWFVVANQSTAQLCSNVLRLLLLQIGRKSKKDILFFSVVIFVSTT